MNQLTGIKYLSGHLIFSSLCYHRNTAWITVFNLSPNFYGLLLILLLIAHKIQVLFNLSSALTIKFNINF